MGKLSIAIVGAGMGGMAAAARLAKLGHRVHLVERSERLGGALAPITDKEGLGFAWDAGPSSTLLPAVLRDLFRKFAIDESRFLNALKEALKEVSGGRSVDVKVKVDPSIIGGLVVKLGSRMVDGSLRTKLNSIRSRMKEVG